jgi:hypothetical protein
MIETKSTKRFVFTNAFEPHELPVNNKWFHIQPVKVDDTDTGICNNALFFRFYIEGQEKPLGRDWWIGQQPINEDGYIVLSAGEIPPNCTKATVHYGTRYIEQPVTIDINFGEL